MPAASRTDLTHKPTSAAIPPKLFPCRLPQRLIDAILPAGPALLEVFENVLIDPQRNQFLHARKRGLFSRCLRHLGCGPLERSFGFGSGVVQSSRSSRLIWHG